MKTVAIPYTCGLSRLFSSAIAGEHSFIYKFTWEVHSCFLLALSLLLSNVTFFETRSYWQGGFTEDQQKYYKEYRLSQKGKHLWIQINKLNTYARNFCFIYDKPYCFDKSCCCRRYKHLPFQCEYNDNEILASYVKGTYEFYDVEQIEEFVAWKGAFEITYLLDHIDDAPYKYEIDAILEHCYINY